MADAAVSPYDFPPSWVADVLASDGGVVHLRPVTPSDAELLVAFHSGLSERTRYMRYFGPYPKMPPRDVVRMTTVDHTERVSFIALLGGEIIAVGLYEGLRAQGKPTSAEVAFVVADEHQGRGLGTILLEHLAGAAAERGFHRFEADVLAENRSMVSVFAQAGYQLSRSYDGSVVHVEFDIDPTEALVSVRNSRERASEAQSVRNALSPSSIAVIGATNKAGKVGAAILDNILAAKFNGPVYPVNGEHDAIRGLPAYASVRDIPNEVDLAVIAVPARNLGQVLTECLAKGVKSLVVVSTAFSDMNGGDTDRRSQLTAAVRGHGMRLIGTNALGIANNDPSVRLNATLAPIVPPRGNVGFFCQSGALGISILESVAARGLGISTFVSAGSRADVSGNDLLQYWDTDADTEVILLYIESFGNPKKFTRIARRVSRNKPIIVVRRSETVLPAHIAQPDHDEVREGPGDEQRKAMLDDASARALLTQAGIIQVDDLGQLFDVAAALSFQPLPRGPKVAVIGNSTALCNIAVDAGRRQGLTMHDPYDVGAMVTPALLLQAIKQALDDPEVDGLIVVFVPPVVVSSEPFAACVREASVASEKPILSTFLAYDGIPDELSITSNDGVRQRSSVPSFSDPARAALAYARAWRYARWRNRPRSSLARPQGIDIEAARTFVRETMARNRDLPHENAASTENDHPLTPKEVAQLMGFYGIDIPGDNHAVTHDQLTGLNCVAGIHDDGLFGAVITFGVAGILSDLLGDVAVRALPVTELDLKELIHAPKASPLLFGYNGMPGVDRNALIDLLRRIAAIAADIPEIRLMRCRPVLAAAQGAFVLDAHVLVGADPRRRDTGPRRLN